MHTNHVALFILKTLYSRLYKLTGHWIFVQWFPGLYFLTFLFASCYFLVFEELLFFQERAHNMWNLEKKCHKKKNFLNLNSISLTGALEKNQILLVLNTTDSNIDIRSFFALTRVTKWYTQTFTYILGNRQIILCISKQAGNISMTYSLMRWLYLYVPDFLLGIHENWHS